MGRVRYQRPREQVGAPSGGQTLPFEDLFGEHGGVDRNLTDYASGRYAYATQSVTSGILVRQATSDVIQNNTATPDLHALLAATFRPGPGGNQYSEIEFRVEGGQGIAELYTRLNSFDQGYGLYCTNTILQLFHWDFGGTNFTGLDSQSVTFSDGDYPRMWQFSETDGSNVRIRYGIVGQGQLGNFLHTGQSGTAILTGGYPGFGWWRPPGAPINPITRFIVGDSIPGYAL